MAIKARMAESEKPLEAVPSYEQEQVSRGLLAWLNQYTGFPAGVKRFDFEFLEEDKPCMALSTIPGTYIIKRYVGGDYRAGYQFKLIYRGQPTTNGDRLKMDEVLDAIGDWAARSCRERNPRLWDKPNIGAGKQIQKITVNARSSLFGRYDNGDAGNTAEFDVDISATKIPGEYTYTSASGASMASETGRSKTSEVKV